jgi:hypothetical protein
MLFLINNLNDSLKDDLESEDDPAGESTNSTKDKEEAPRLAPEKMLQASQNMMVLKYISNHARMKKVAIGLSAWISKIKQRECLLIKFNGHSFFFFAYKTH